MMSDAMKRLTSLVANGQHPDNGKEALWYLLGQCEDELKKAETKKTEDERGLRRLLWLRHGCKFAALYGDDGEMQCSECGVDFKRMTDAQIDAVFRRGKPTALPKANEGTWSDACAGCGYLPQHCECD